MYNIDNSKSDMFYVYDHIKERYVFSGNKRELIAFIANTARNTHYKDTSRWEFSAFDEVNMTLNDVTKYYEYFYPTFNLWKHYENPLSGNWIWRVKTFVRVLTVFDGYFRIIDIRDFREDVIKFILSGDKVLRRRYKSKRQSRRYHSDFRYRHKMPRTVRILRENSIPEYKEYKRKTLKNIPEYDNDCMRRISCSWKDQRKYKKQWMHKAKAHDTVSIRKDFFPEE